MNRVPPRSTRTDPLLPYTTLFRSAAGCAAAQRLRELGFGGRLSMPSADADAPCDRPNLSKDYLAGTADEDWIPLQGPAFYPEHDIDLRLGCEVTAIDTAARQVHLGPGARLDHGPQPPPTAPTPPRPPP